MLSSIPAYGQFLETLPSAGVVFDLDGVIVLANAYAHALFAYGKDELVSRPLGVLFTGDAGESLCNELLSQGATPAQPNILKLTGQRSDGSHFLVEMLCSPLAIGGESFIVGNLRDISHCAQNEVALRQSEELLRASVNVAGIGIFDHDPLKDTLYWSPRMREMHGVGPDELLVMGTYPEFLHPDDLARIMASVVQAHDPAGDGLWDEEYRIFRRDGQLRWLSAKSQTYFQSDGERRFPMRTVGAVLDITEHKKAEQALKKFRYSVEQAPDAIHWLERDGSFAFFNDETCRSLGYTREEMAEMNLWDVDPVFPPPVWESNWDQYENTGQAGIERGESYHRRKDGSLFPIEFVARHMWFDGQPLHVAYVRDISERKETEERIKVSLAEKDVLLKEIHHRVKNNLQIISSLLYLQTRKIADPSMISMLKESQNRIASMALIHEKLYQSTDLARIDFVSYAQELADFLFQSYGVDKTRISLEVTGRQIHLNVNDAVPCGLIINEIVSNSLKHAFPGDRQGVIRIELSQENEVMHRLYVCDDGIGLPTINEKHARTSLGLQLIERLVGQLQGELEIESSGEGTHYRITLPQEK